MGRHRQRKSLLLATILILGTVQLRGDPDIIISEINSCCPNKNIQREFVELHFVDVNRFLMLRNPRLRIGPPLKNHYILIIEAFDKKYDGPVISTVVDLTQSAFKYDRPFFTIGTRTYPDADLYFESSENVYTTQNVAGIVQSKDFLDEGSEFPVGVLLIETSDRKFIGEHLMLTAIRPYVYITDEIINFVNETIVDAVIYGRNVKIDRDELFDRILDKFNAPDRYVLKNYDYMGDSELSLGKCPTGADPLTLRQPFAPGLFKLGLPTHGEPNDCTASTFFLEMLASPDTFREELLRKTAIRYSKEEKQGRDLPPFEASECLMKHTRHNRDPTACGQQGTEAGTLQKLTQFTDVSLANERHAAGLVSVAEAILARSDGFYRSEDHDLEQILTCKKHAEEFGQGWFFSLPRTKRQDQRPLTCKFPLISGASDTQKPHETAALARPNTFVSKEESEAVLTLKNVFIPPGWPICQAHKEYLAGFLKEYTAPSLQKLEEEKQLNQRYFLRPRKTVCKPWQGSQSTDTSGGGSQGREQSDSEYWPSQEKMDVDIPEKSAREREIDEVRCAVSQLAKAANIAKVRFTDDLSACKRSTFEVYARIGRRLCNAVSFAIAPYQSGELSKVIVADPNKARESGKDIEKLQALMQAIADAHNEAKSPSMRNMILSLLAPYTTYNELAAIVPTLTFYKFKTARLYAKMYGPGTEPPEKIITRDKTSKTKLISFIDFLLSSGVSVELPYGEVHVKLSSGETETIPNLLRVMNDEYTADLYIETLKEMDKEESGVWDRLGMSRSTLLKILKILKSSHLKQIRGIDYFHYHGSAGFTTLLDIVMVLEEKRLVDTDWTTSVKKRLHDLHFYLRAEFRGTIRETSQVADFCSTFALSDPNNAEFSAAKTTPTELISSQGRLLLDTIAEIAENVHDADYSNDRDKVEAEYLVGVAKYDILNWKAHIVRTFRQNQGRHEAMENLERHQTIIWLDWAMKWIPELAKEDQASFFGKAGIPWHVSVAFKRNTDGSGYDVRYFVHSFQSTKQDSAAVVAIINDTLTRIKSECNYLTQAIIFSDNAGCYKSGITIATMPRMKADTGIDVVRWDFSDPQSGKGPADRFAATAKRKARIFLAEGNDCNTADAFVTCITSHRGSEGMTAIVSQLDCKENSGKPSKIRDITKLQNFQFIDNNLLVHRAYKIGRGRSLALATLNPSHLQCELKPIRVVNRDIEQNAPLTNDAHWKSLPIKDTTEVEQHVHEDDETSETSESDIQQLKSTTGLFMCPIPGCTKVFQRYKNLQRHLELGNHQFKPEKESLRDFVIREYKDRVEGLRINRFQQMREAINDVGSTLTCPRDIVSDGLQGWALPTRKVERYSKDVRDYLNAKFDEGIQHRRKKWKPDEVAKAMRKDERFSASEFLSTRQVASYFSRLAKQREKQPTVTIEAPQNEADSEEDDEENEDSNDFEENPLEEDDINEMINEARRTE